MILAISQARTIQAVLQSRMQLAMCYKDLTTEQKISVYQNKIEYMIDEAIKDNTTLIDAIEYSPLVAKADKANWR